MKEKKNPNVWNKGSWLTNVSSPCFFDAPEGKQKLKAAKFKKSLIPRKKLNATY